MSKVLEYIIAILDYTITSFLLMILNAIDFIIELFKKK